MPELRYAIHVNADTSGAPKAEAAIKGVTAASAEANAAASAHAAGAAQMWSGLQQAAQGGTNAIVGLGRAIGGAFQAAMGAVPIAKWIAMAAQLVGVLSTVVAAMGLIRKSADETKTPVDALTTAQDAAKRSAEALAKAYSDNLTSALKAIATDAVAAIDWAKQLAAANEEVAKSIDNKTKAEIGLKQANGTISEAQATTQLAGVDAAAAARQAQGRLDAIRTERDEMQKALDRAQSVSETPRKALETLNTQRSDAQARQRAVVTARFEYAAAQDQAYSYKNAFGVPWMELDAPQSAESADQVKAFGEAKKRYQAAESAYAQALASAPDADSLQELDTSIAQAWKDWTAASAPVQELKKKTDELTKTLDLRTKTEQQVLQNNSGADTAKNTPAISDEQKAKNEAARKAAEDRKVATYQQLGSGVLAESSARGTRTLDAEIWKRAFPNKPFPQSAQPSAPSLSTPTTPAAPAQPGLGVVPAGTALPAWQQSPHTAMRLGGGALPTNTTGVYAPGQALPTGAVDPRNQITRGQLQPGSDNNQFQESAEKINDGMTKAAEQEVPDLKPAAEAADILVAKGEELATSLQQTGDSMVAAFGQVAEQQGGIVAVQSNQQAQIAQLKAHLRQLDSAIATLRQRSQVA